MKSCKHVLKQLSAYLSGELAPAEQRGILEHLETCPDCRFQAELTRSIIRDAQAIGEEAKTAAENLPWNQLEVSIFNDVTAQRRTGFLRPALIQAAMVACFILPLAWLLLGNGFVQLERKQVVQVTPDTMSRMETNVARTEVQQVLQKSRIVLSDFMRQCPETDGSSTQWKTPTREIQSVMVQNRMLSRDLDQIPLQNARDICQKLNFVFAEIVSINQNNSCRNVTRLQQLLQRDKLLLKIRLVEEELKKSEG